MNRYSVIFLLSWIFLSTGLSSPLPDARLTVKIVNEDGYALTNMPITIGFSEESHSGYSDSNGLFTATGKERYGDPGFVCTNAGYYSSHLQYKYSGGDTNSNRWLPWDPVATLVVRRVVNPIPAYWKTVETRVPLEDVVIGFDLKAGDWVAPHGEGETVDFPIVLTRRVTSTEDYEGTLTIAFTNSYDGICMAGELFEGSQFMLSRQAPEKDYLTNYTYRVGRDLERGRYGANVNDPEKYYYFRIRSIVDDEGALKEASYGKLYGRIKFGGILSTNNPRLHFTYYLNPTPNDRNMEFDPKKNLFKNLSSLEEVSAP